MAINKYWESANQTNIVQYQMDGDAEIEIIPRRKITSMKWNGPILQIKGYAYFEGIPMLTEDNISKQLVLVSKGKDKFKIQLRDVPIHEITMDNIEIPDDIYLWSGFKGEINLARITKNKKPLPASTYRVMLKVSNKNFSKKIPLGNIEHFLRNGFYATKMEHYSADSEMKYNLLATYDLKNKTMELRSIKLKDINPSENQKSESKSFDKLSKSYFKWLYRVFTLLPLKENRVLFASDSRDELSGNFKFVYDEMLKRDRKFDFRFMLKGALHKRKSAGELIKLAYYLATSKYILLDDFYPMVYPLKIRRGAELVQLWHAVGAFKTFGYSRIGLPGGPSPKSKNHRNYTKAIVSSQNVAKHYAEGFGIEEERIVPTGIPRTDVFFDEEYKESTRMKLLDKYPYMIGKKVITFAPTFRGNGQMSAHYPMEALNLHELYTELNSEYVFLFKMHPFVKNELNIPYRYKDFFYDFSDYREINDLLFVTDILITDYSSVCFEFSLLRRPMLFYAFDVEEYVRGRDFYCDYQDFIPGTMVRNTSEIINAIRNEQFNMDKIDPFVNYYFDHLDGKSSERVVNQIFFGNT